MNKFDYSIHYDNMSAGNDGASLWGAQRYVRQMSQWLPKREDSRILEIGPGNGLTLQVLTKAGYNVEAIEADEELASRLTAKGLNARWVTAEETKAFLLQNHGVYDLIYAHHVIEHIPVPEQLQFIRYISHALKPGGYFVCETPNALSSVASWYRSIDWTHTSIFTPPSLTFVMAAGGLEPKYVGQTLGGRAPSFVHPVKAAVEWIVSGMLLPISRLIHRIHLVAELRTFGLRAPLTVSLLGVGQKRKIHTPDNRPAT